MKRSELEPPATAGQPRGRGPLGLLLVASFLSGAAALTYQLLWIRELTLLAGSTQAAISCVVSVFFLGLALGNGLAGRLVLRLRRPLGAYLLMELGIAAWALLFYPLLGGLDGFYAQLYQSLPHGSPWIHVLRLASSVLLLLVPSVCMGATLPLLVQAASFDLATASRWSGLLYGVNTLGAVAGTFATGFFVIEHFGVSLPMRATALLNVASGLCVLPLLGRLSFHPRPGERSERLSRFGTLVLASFGVLGFANIAAQVLWTRFFALIFSNDTYIFTAILLVFLVGIGVGSLVGEALSRRVRGSSFQLGLLQLVSTAWTVGMIYVVPRLASIRPEVYRFEEQIQSYFLSVAVGILPQTLCMGASFPVLVRTVMEHHRQAGPIVGRALAWNTLGGVLGAAVAGFLLLDRLGLGPGILVVAGLTAAVGLVLCFASPARSPVRWVPVAALVGVPAVLAVARPPELPEALLRTHFVGYQDMRIVETRPSVHGTVTITEEASRERRVWINNYWVARETSHLSFGYVPWILHPGPVDQGLGVCFGTGRTFGALLNTGVGRYDLVEINPQVVALSGSWLARSNYGVTEHPRANIVIDDGRNFVRYSGGSYDLITLEPLQMFQKGVVYFYTEDFYREARARMNPGAVLSQWMPIYLVGEQEFRSMVKTFVQVFPTALLWSSPTETVLLGYNTDDPRVPHDLKEIEERISLPAVREGLAESGLPGPYDVLVCSLVDGHGLAAIGEGGQVYTDDRPTMEFTAPRRPGDQPRNLELIRANLVPLGELYDFGDDELIRDLSRLRELLLDSTTPPAARNAEVGEIYRRLGAKRAARD